MMRPANVLISPLVLVLGFSSLLAQSTYRSRASDANSTITGRVLGGGKPLIGAVITLWRQPVAEPAENNRATTAQTDAAGNYALADVPAGNYFISATAPGFVTGKENQVFENLRYLTVIAGQPRINGMNFELVPEGVIKGTVTDADGKRVSHTLITIVPEALLPSVAGPPPYTRNLRTDDRGMFRIIGLPAGRYRLAAGYVSVASATFFGQTGYRQTFYPDAADEARAGVVEIAAGSEVTDIDINVGRAVKTFSVSAKLVDSQTREPVRDIDYALAAYSNDKQIGEMQSRERSNSRGEITIRNLPPGEYLIRVPAGRLIIPAGDIPTPPNLFGESKRFNVTDGDVGEIEIPVLKAATVSGFVVIEGLAEMDVLARVPQMRVMVMVEPKPGSVSPMTITNIKPDGSFTFTGLTPGKLRIHFIPPPVGGPLPLRSIRIERDGVKLDHDLEIEAGEQIVGLRLVLGYGSGSIQGVVKFANGSLPPGAKLIARAFLGKKDGPPLGYIPVDSQGRFLIQNLPAGEYRLVISKLDSSSISVEQKVVVSDNATTETTILVDLAARANPR